MFVRPWTLHGTLNLSDAPARFQVIGAPSAMTWRPSPVSPWRFGFRVPVRGVAAGVVLYS